MQPDQEQISTLENKLHTLRKKTPEKVDTLNELAWQIRMTDTNRAIELARQGYEMARELGYDRGLAYGRRNMGGLHFFESEFEEAVTVLSEALEWFDAHEKEPGKADVTSILGVMYWSFGDFQKGFENVNTALNLYRESNDANGEAWVLHTLGGFYYDLKNYRESLDVFQMARDLFIDLSDRGGEARTLNGIGNAYRCLGDEDRSLEYQLQSLEIHREIGSEFGESRTLNDIGHIYGVFGENEKALEYYQKSLEIRRRIDYPQGAVTSLIDLGNMYLKLSRREEALAHFSEALTTAERIRARPKMVKAAYGLYKTHRALANYEQALKYHEQFHEYEEAVFHEDTEQRLKNLQATFQLENSRKEAEIYRLRNGELKESNEQLRETLEKLNAAQAQLLQSEKMAALGNLVAGVAHEINSPVGTIRSAADVSNRGLTKVMDRLKHLGNDGNGASGDLRKTLQILTTNNENILEAAGRIIDVGRSLKNFARLDEASYQRANIHDGIDSTLTLLTHDIGERITVEKRYGDVPPIYCYPNQLNQVFMNLLINAIQAMSDGGRLTIETQMCDNEVCIRITDTGKGIPPEKLTNLFEPGFTHKNGAVRMRTGLYTTYTVVQKHNGTIDVESTIGRGTSFIIKLPVEHRTTGG